MGKRVESTGVAGCLMAFTAAVVGFAVWLHGARPGVSGGLEGRRDWSLLYVELPLMLLGMPAVTAAVWGLTGFLLRRGTGRAARTAAPASAAVLTVLVLAWAGAMWLEARVAPFTHPPW